MPGGLDRLLSIMPGDLNILPLLDVQTDVGVQQFNNRQKIARPNEWKWAAA